MMKICTKCQIEKSLDEFYKDKRRSDGLRGWCKKCEKGHTASYQKTKQGKQTRRRYEESPKGKLNRQRCDRSAFSRTRRKHYNASEKGKVYFKKARENHPRRTRARDAVNNAVKAGILPHVNTFICIYCGKQAEEYHHYKGYNEKYYLDVQPVCHTCHRATDNGLT